MLFSNGELGNEENMLNKIAEWSVILNKLRTDKHGSHGLESNRSGEVIQYWLFKDLFHDLPIPTQYRLINTDNKGK